MTHIGKKQRIFKSSLYLINSHIHGKITIFYQNSKPALWIVNFLNVFLSIVNIYPLPASSERTHTSKPAQPELGGRISHWAGPTDQNILYMSLFAIHTWWRQRMIITELLHLPWRHLTIRRGIKCNRNLQYSTGTDMLVI